MTEFFEGPKDFRAKIKAHSKGRSLLKAGFRTTPNGHACISLEDARAEALSFGYCDLKRVSIDARTYTVTFGPRPANARWSAEDVALAEGLIETGTMRPEGLRAFQARRMSPSKSDPDPSADLSPMMLAELKRHGTAWMNFQKLPHAKRLKSAAWVMSAKLEKTRSDRFAKLLMDMGRPKI